MGKWDEITSSERNQSLSWEQKGRQYDLYKEHLAKGGTADDVRRSELFAQQYDRPHAPGQTYPQGEAAYAQEALRGHAQQLQRFGNPSFMGGTMLSEGGKVLDPVDRGSGFVQGVGSSLQNIWNAGEQGVNVARHAMGNITTDELAESDRKAQEDYKMGQIQSRYGGGEVGAGQFWGDMAGLAPAEQLRIIQWAKKHPWFSSATVGGISSASLPVDMPEGATFGDYLTEKGFQAAPGALFGFVAQAGQDIAARRFRNKNTIEKAAKDFNEMMGANTEDSAVTGEMVKEYLEWVDMVESVGVGKAYDKIMTDPQYAGKSINIGSFYNEIKRMSTQEWDEMGHPAVDNLYNKLRGDLKVQLGKPGKPLTDKQLDKIENPQLEIGIEALDNLEKKIGGLINRASEEMGQGTPKHIAKKIRGKLHEGVIEGHGHDILKTARDTAKQSFADRGVVVGRGKGRKKISLSDFVRRYPDEEVVKRVFIDGDEKAVAKALEIMRQGSRFGGKYTKKMGEQAVDNMRAILFKDGMEQAVDMSSGSPVFRPDKFWSFVNKKVGKKKMEMIFSEGEMQIIDELGSMENRGLFDAVKAIFAGPRLTVKKKAIREGLGLLMKTLYKGKQTTEFADAVASQLGITGWRGMGLNLTKKTPVQIMFGLMGRDDSGRWGNEAELQKGAR